MCLDTLKHTFLSGQGGCNSACRYIQLGTLVEKMYDLLGDGLSQPLQDGTSLSEFIDRVRQIEAPAWYGNSSGCTRSHRRGSATGNCCLQRHRCTATPKRPGESSPWTSFGGESSPSPALTGSSFIVGSAYQFGNAAVNSSFGESFVEGLCELDKCVQSAIGRAELQMDGLELSDFL